ncbi:MAG: bifunctional pyr operon transcriptional regulator/uracil phosphoribosyltransferase PyrR [Myxococcales bacterium]|nr:bifunctional pyr operon transcriptional regulator/uracil phosphoribosyltransferase PyrR [Myxococcales bacterium]
MTDDKKASTRREGRHGLIFKDRLLDSAGVGDAVERLADSIAARQGTIPGALPGISLVGVHSGGVPLAKRLAAALERRGHDTEDVGMIDITLYRDDAFLGLPQPIVGQTDLDFDISGRRLILIDDVLYTGRTIRAALDALIDFGRPRCIELAVLVDRGHRELPIQPDHVGLRVTTTRNESVRVGLVELGDPEDEVILEERRP